MSPARPRTFTSGQPHSQELNAFMTANYNRTIKVRPAQTVLRVHGVLLRSS
jgi:hypothetical protein